MIVILHNIRSIHNIGSIFRTSDCAGVGEIYLSGYTASPIDRFGRKRSDFAKVALGSEESVPWERVEDILDCISILQKDGSKVYAVEQSKLSRKYSDVIYGERDVFIFGNEVDGLDASVLDAVDEVIEITMQGDKESLNVSVCAGVVLFNARLGI